MVRPLKAAASRFVARPLNVIFGAPSHIAILRALSHAVGGLTGREVARLAHVAQFAAMGALSRLEAAGIVRRRPAGRAYLFDLNRKHMLVKGGILPLLEQEGRFRSRLRRILQGSFGERVLSAAIFGSVAREEDRPESDLDICLFVRREADKEIASKQAGRASRRLFSELGLTLSPILFTQGEFRRGFRKGEDFFRNVVNEAEPVYGVDLSEVIGGKENPARSSGQGKGRKLRGRRK